MDLGIIERMVCPRGHASSLVVRADAVGVGRLEAGALGCPECNEEWPVVMGAAQFGARSRMDAIDAGDPMAVAAFLNLTEPGLAIVCDGARPDLLNALALEFGALIIAMDAADAPSAVAGVVDGAARVPFGNAALRGALLLRPARSAEFVESAVHAVAHGSRVVAAAAIAATTEMRQLARDERLWVAERGSAPVALRRAR